MHKLVFLGIILLLQVSPLSAQQSNLEIFQRLAVSCLFPVPNTFVEFKLTPSPHAPYIKSKLISKWNASNHRLYLADTTERANLPRLPHLIYTIQQTSVSYNRLKKNLIKRNVELTTTYTLSNREGLILEHDICTKTASDTISYNALSMVESDLFPETQGAHPPAGWAKRYLEPIVLGAATVLGVYLFFILRSDSNNDGV